MMDDPANQDQDVLEFNVSNHISQGSIVAVVASPDEFWLVTVSSSLGAANIRWLGTWLEKAPVKRIRGAPHIDGTLYTIAKGCDEACVWRDTILCDLTAHILVKDENTWLLPKHVNSQVEQLLARQSHDDNPKHLSFCSIPRAPVQIEGGVNPWNADTVQNLVDKCSDALCLVCGARFYV